MLQEYVQKLRKKESTLHIIKIEERFTFKKSLEVIYKGTLI